MYQHRGSSGDSPQVLIARSTGPRRRRYDLFAGICPVVLDVTLADTDRARDLLSGHKRISSRDAVHAAVMLNHQADKIATFDAGFDGIAGSNGFPWRSRASRQASTCPSKCRSTLALYAPARSPDIFSISPRGIGWKAFAVSILCSINSILGMPTTAAVTASESEY